MEIIDIVDQADNVIGSAEKTDVIAKGLTCRVSFVMIQNDAGEFFLQQRKATKKTYPLYWSGAAAGHVASGETYEDAALRELAEELGVFVPLQSIGKKYSEADKEFVTFFVGQSNGPFRLEETAIETAEFRSLEQLKHEIVSMKATSYLETALTLITVQYSANK